MGERQLERSADRAGCGGASRAGELSAKWPGRGWQHFSRCPQRHGRSPPAGSRWAGAAVAGIAGRGSRCPAPRAKQQVIFTRWYLQNVQLICHPEPGSFPLPPPSPFPLSPCATGQWRAGDGRPGWRRMGDTGRDSRGSGCPRWRLWDRGTGVRAVTHKPGRWGAWPGKARIGAVLGPRAPPAAEHRSWGAEEERGAAGAQSRGGLGGGPGRRASCQEARAGAGLALPLAVGPAP